MDILDDMGVSKLSSKVFCIDQWLQHVQDIVTLYIKALFINIS